MKNRFDKLPKRFGEAESNLLMKGVSPRHYDESFF